MDLNAIFSYIDRNENEFITRLKEWVAIESVSSDPARKADCFKMVTVVANDLKKVGCDVRVVDNPSCKQTTPDSQTFALPPIILATYGSDTSKQTLCIYGHVDVQPAKKDDGWNTEPFQLTPHGDKLIGRGSSDDKGPVLGWLCVLQAFKELDIKPNINLKFVFECMEEVGSDGLDQLLEAEKFGFLSNVDYICISDNYWVGTRKPCITYGLRGICYFKLEVSGPSVDLHSGVYGGTIHEPITILIFLLSKLVNDKGRILIPGIYDKVPECSQEEIENLKTIDFDPTSYAEELKCSKDQLLYTSKVDILAHRWRYPCLSIHGIEGAFSDTGSKTVIPAKVIGKFSIRLVHNMTPHETTQLVKDYIFSQYHSLKSPSHIRFHDCHSASPWISNTNSPNYQAAIRATKLVYGVDPDLTREGGSIPISLTFAKVTGKSVVLIPMGRGDDGAHSQNEKLNKSNFLKGTKQFAAYIAELAQQAKK